MTADDFRRIALSLPEASECAHMGHPDFRLRGKIFATLGYPDEHWGMVKLLPKQQAAFIKLEFSAFVPAKGGWGRRGSTHILLERVDESTLRRALTAAWRKIAPKTLAAEFDEKGPIQPSGP
jgi:hypothetical protein